MTMRLLESSLIHAVAAAIAGAALAVSLSGGCGGDTSVVEDLCVRGDECNALPSSVQECIDQIGNCVDDLTPNQRSDWENSISDCLELQVCSSAIECYNAVPHC